MTDAPPRGADPPSDRDLERGLRLLERAVRVARRSLGRIGLAPADAAALYRPEDDRTLTSAQLEPPPAWCGDRLLARSAPGALLATVVEPPADRVEAIRRAGIDRVWVAIRHPDRDYGGRFASRARRAGLATTIVDDPRAGQLHEVYRSVVDRRRAFVVLKVASSLDGRIATRTGESQWITGPRARARGRRLRAELDAILVGVDTVIADDPQLTARQRGASDPVRLVLDSRLRTPAEATVAQTARVTPTVVFTTDRAPAGRRRALEALGVRVVRMPRDASGRVDVAAVLEWMAQQGLPGLLVEGGGAVHGAFVDAGLVDRIVWFQAPTILGPEGRPAVGGMGPERLADAFRLATWTVRRLGDDFMVEGRRGR